MEKKYELTEETIEYSCITLHRIKALKDFGDVKAGDLGGFIESERNLSQYGNAWVYDDAKVYDYAWVYGDAKIRNNAVVYDDAEVRDSAEVYGNAEIRDSAQIFDNAKVCDNAWIHGGAWVYENACVYGNVELYDRAEVCGDAKIYGLTEVYKNTEIFGYAKVCSNIKIFGNARICNNADYIVFKNWWSSGRYFTWTRSNNMWSVGCFYGTGEELIKKAYKDSELSGREYERVVKYVESILKGE